MDLSTKKAPVESLAFILAIISATIILMFFPVRIFSFYFIFAIFFIVAFFLINNKLGLLLILLVRPLLDVFTNFEAIRIGFLSLNVSAILAIATLFLALVVYFKNRGAVRNLPAKIAWGIFLAVTALSAAISFDHATSLAEVARLFSIVSLFMFGFILTETAADLTGLLSTVACSAIIPSFFAVYQFATGTGMTIPLEGITNRIYGTFAHPNLFAYYLVFLIIILWYLIAVKKINPALNALVLIFYAVLLTLTFTRGAWLALVLTFSIIGLIKYRRMLVVMALIMILVYAAVEPIRSRVDVIWQYNPGNSIAWREGIWNDGVNIAKEKIFQGYGTGTAQEILLEARGPEAGSPDPHNDYLKLFIENGLVGVLAYAALIQTLLYNLIKGYKNSPDVKMKDLYLTLFAFSVALFTLSSADNILRNTALQWAFWTVIGGTLTLSRREKEIVS